MRQLPMRFKPTREPKPKTSMVHVRVTEVENKRLEKYAARFFGQNEGELIRQALEHFYPELDRRKTRDEVERRVERRKARDAVKS